MISSTLGDVWWPVNYPMRKLAAPTSSLATTLEAQEASAGSGSLALANPSDEAG